MKLLSFTFLILFLFETESEAKDQGIRKRPNLDKNYDTSTIITIDDFEDNWGSYKSGGNDALLVNYHARGGHAVKIRDGSVAVNASFFHHSNHDVTKFDILSVHFWFKSILKKNQYFVLEYSSDGGLNWDIVKKWKNVTQKLYQKEKVFINKNKVEFTSKSRLRFRCSANKKKEMVFIDNVEFRGYEWTTITFDEFEDGWGSYESGGSDASLVNYPSQTIGGYAVRIRDGSIESKASFFHHSNHDVTQFSILCVRFWFKALRLDKNDTFLLEYSSDGGNNWNIVKTWSSLSILETKYKEKIVFITKSQVDFTSMARLRFRCITNKKNQVIFIDHVLFSGDDSIDQTSTPSLNMTPLPTLESSSNPTPSITKAPSLNPIVTSPPPQTSKPTISEAGLRITFNENGIPISIKNSSGREFVRQKQPFSKGFTNGNGRSFNKISDLGNGEYKFESKENPKDYFTVIIEEKNNYIIIRYTSLPLGNLIFHLMAGQLKAIQLDYMITRVRLSNSFLIVERLESWERSGNNPLGGFAIYEKDHEKEDDILLDLWLNNDYLPHPMVKGSWDREAALSWLDRFRDNILDESTLYLQPKSLQDHYDSIPFVKLLDARNIYLFPQFWRGEYILNYRKIDDINEKMYPNALSDILELIQMLSPYNITLRFHTLSGFVGRHDPDFVESSVHPGLFIWGNMTLKENLKSTQTSCIVKPESGVVLPDTKGKWPTPGVLPQDYNINTFRIGNNWLKANKVHNLGDGTWKLENIMKGNRVNYNAGETISGYATIYNRGFIADPNKELLNIIAKRFATLSNKIGLSNTNFDGYLIPGATGRFGCHKYAQFVYQNLDHPTSTTTSIGGAPPAWIEYKFPRVNKGLQKKFNTQLGVGLFLQQKSRAATGLEDAEHLMFRQMASNNRHFSLGGGPSSLFIGVTLKTLRAHGLTNEIINSIKLYKRASFNMSNTQRNEMMKSFSFSRSFNGSHKGAKSLWRPEGTELRQWFALGTDIYTNLWWLGQEHGTITPRFYVQNGINQNLEVPEDLHKSGANNVRVIGRILPRFERSSENNINLMKILNEESILIEKSNQGNKPIWSHSLQSYKVKPLNLSNNRGIGLSITGDGCGATLVIRLHSGKGRDYVVPINFVGKKWIEIPNGEQGWRVKSWGWTNKAHKVLNYWKVNQIMIGLGHIPQNTSCSVLIEGLTALSEIHETFVSPSITLGQNLVNISGEIDTENHFILDPNGKFTVYDQSWNVIYFERLESLSLSSTNSINFRMQSVSSPTIWLEVGVQASSTTSLNPEHNPPIFWSGGDSIWTNSSNWKGSSIPNLTTDVVVDSFATVTNGKSDFASMKVEWGSSVVSSVNEFSKGQSLIIKGTLDGEGDLNLFNSELHLIGSLGHSIQKITIWDSIIKFDDGAAFQNSDMEIAFKGTNTCAFRLSTTGFTTILAGHLDLGFSSWSEFNFEIDLTRYSSQKDEIVLMSFSSHHYDYEEEFNPKIRIFYGNENRNVDLNFEKDLSSLVIRFIE